MARPILVVDVETTGVNPTSDSIVEIGACLLSPVDFTEVRRFHSRVRPTSSVGEEALGIHGLTDQILAAAPAVDTVMEAFLAFAPEDAIIAGHNVAFDIAFLKAAFQNAGLAYPFDYHSIDVWSIAYVAMAGGDDDSRSFRLDALSRRFGLDRPSLHSALEDATITSEVLRRLRLKIANCESAV